MDLFRDIKKGKFGNDPHLKKEAKHELKELGGEKVAEKHEEKVKKMAGKMKPQRKTWGNITDKEREYLTDAGIYGPHL